jgi:vesicle-associated membrane protein 8
LDPPSLGLIDAVVIQEEGSRGGENDRVRNLQSEVEGVKNIMTQNVERILARGENLDHLRNKTEDLEATVRQGAHWSWWKRGRENC